MRQLWEGQVDPNVLGFGLLSSSHLLPALPCCPPASCLWAACRSLLSEKEEVNCCDVSLALSLQTLLETTTAIREEAAKDVLVFLSLLVKQMPHQLRRQPL